MKIVNYFFSFIMIVLLFAGCVTYKNCIKKSNLCGIVVDENNKPVSNYLIICDSNPFNKVSTYTNDNGIFLLSDMEVGTYNISGRKQNFGKIDNDSFYFDGSSSMLCYQVSSLEELLFRVNKCIDNKEYEKAINIVNKIEIDENQYNYGLILLYKEYLYIKLKDVDAYMNCIRLLKKIKNDKCRKIIEKGDVGL